MSRRSQRKLERQESRRRQAAVRAARRSLENPALPLDDPAAWDEVFGDATRSHAGEPVSAKSALSIPAVWQAVECISGDLSKIPLAPYKRTDGPNGPGTGKVRDDSHAAFSFFHLSGTPNEETASFEFWRRLTAQAALYSDAYAWLDWSPDGRLRGAYNLLPDRTHPHRSKTTGELWYVTEIDGELEPLRFHECLHIKRFSLNNQTGVQLLNVARHLLGKALAKEKFESKFFKNNATLGGVLMAPQGALDDAIKNVEEGFKKKYASTEQAFKIAVLRDGFRFERTQSDPKGAMLGELGEAAVRDVARLFNIPPSRLGAKDSVSYNSEEAARRFYHESTLSPWLMGIAGECNLKLLTADERAAGMFFEHTVDALLWTDAKNRMDIFSRGIELGIYSPDEARAAENRPPRPDGKGGEYLRPLNLTPANGSTATATEEEEPEIKPPSKPVEPKVDDDEEDDSESRLAAVANVAHAAFLDAFARAKKRLDNAAGRCKTEADVAEFRDTFEEKHLAAVREIFASPVAMLRELKRVCWRMDLDPADSLARAYEEAAELATETEARDGTGKSAVELFAEGRDVGVEHWRKTCIDAPLSDWITRQRRPPNDRTT